MQPTRIAVSNSAQEVVLAAQSGAQKIPATQGGRYRLLKKQGEAEVLADKVIATRAGDDLPLSDADGSWVTLEGVFTPGMNAEVALPGPTETADSITTTTTVRSDSPVVAFSGAADGHQPSVVGTAYADVLLAQADTGIKPDVVASGAPNPVVASGGIDPLGMLGIAGLGVVAAAAAGGSSNPASVVPPVDTTAPTASIVVADTALKAGETSLVTITFSEAVTGFANADLSIANGTLSAVASTDGGVTWTATLTPTADTTDATNLVTLANTGVTDAAGNAGSGTTDSNNYAIDTTAPTATNTIGAYTASTDTLVLTGTNYSTLLEAGESASTDIKARLDWSKLSWDINGDNAATADVSFVVGDISSAKVTDGTHLTIVLSGAKGSTLEATTGYAGVTLDTLDITAGFAQDVAGNAATTDAVTNAPLFTHAGQSVIDLGSYGKLITPVQVEGNWYYHWDRSGDGTSADTGSLNGGVDYTTHNVLDGIFTSTLAEINAGTVGSATDTTDLIRYATLNGVKLALPKVGGVTSSPYGSGGINNSQPGTTVGSGSVENSTYDDLLAIWDAYNGTGTGTGTDGTPSGWQSDDGFWSATPSVSGVPLSSGHAVVDLDEGDVDHIHDNYVTYVALQVL